MRSQGPASGPEGRGIGGREAPPSSRSPAPEPEGKPPFFAAPNVQEKNLKLTIIKGEYSESELRCARYMSELGNEVVLRPASGSRLNGGTSDLLVNGLRYDVYTPITPSPDRIVSLVAKKNQQAVGVIVDLSKTSVKREQLGNVLQRVRGAGAKNIQDVIIIGDK